MKLRFVFALFFSALATVVLMSNKNGRASVGVRGSTGAPGDEVVSGQLRTCQNCHAGGNFNLSVSLDFFNADSSKAAFFVPGSEYSARVKVKRSGAAPARFGFQMIGVLKGSGAEHKGFSAPSANAKLTTPASGPQAGRTYAEHKTASTDSVFWVKWKAPATTGTSVDFYVAAIGANNNSQSGGDAGVKAVFNFSDQTLSSGEAEAAEKSDLRVLRDPLAGGSFFAQAENATAGERLFEVFSMDGRLVFSEKMKLVAGVSTFEIDAAGWPSGLFLLKMSEKGRFLASAKLLNF